MPGPVGLGFNEQSFGADEQNLGRGQSDQGEFDPTRCRAERGRILVSAPLRQPTPAVNGRGLSRLLRAAARHLDMLDGERNLASKQLRRL